MEVLGLLEVFEPMPAEVAQHHLGTEVGEQRAGRFRDDDLTAVCRGRYPRRAVHVDPDVTVLMPLRFTGMDAHPYTHRNVVRPFVSQQLPLPLDRRVQRVACRAEDDEEAVTLGAHLMSMMGDEGLPKDQPVRRERLAPPAAQHVEHGRRALDVAEQQRHRPTRQGAHAGSIVPIGRFSEVLSDFVTHGIRSRVPRGDGMRYEGSVTALSWIPSEAVTGVLFRVPFEVGVSHYDDPPPDVMTDIDGILAADRARFINRLSAWVEVRDGVIVDHGQSGGGRIGSTTLRMESGA